jgi:3-methylfumaryl-CoA hydratase
MNAWEPWIGRVTTTSAWLDPGQANRMSATLDRDPRFTAGDALPPAWHWLYFHDIVRASDLGVDGHPRLGVTMPPVPLAQRMWAGGTLVFEEPLRLGATVERISTIRSVTPKQGRTGHLFFVTVEHDLRTKGTRNVLEHQTIVYREEMAAAAGVPAAPPAPCDAAFSASWSLDSTALFRYSALTFNGHRIHYDADYCRDVEGYPGLVVHGPLVATLLLDLAVGERRPAGRFTYRARSPLFLPHTFTVNGRPDGAGTTLWAASDAGILAMQAQAAA